MNKDLVILSRAELLAIRNSLQFCNDSPNGGISDTLWMMDSPETIFDAFDELLNKAQVVDGEPLVEMIKSGNKMDYTIDIRKFEDLPDGTHKLFIQPQPAITEGFQLTSYETTWDMRMAGIKALLEITNGELECIGERLLDEYSEQVTSIYKAMLSAAKKEGV